jgi:hypothetical protein
MELPSVCEEKVALLHAWSKLMTRQSHLAVELSRAAEMADMEAHAALSIQFTEALQESLAAKLAYQTHRLTHGCDPPLPAV